MLEDVREMYFAFYPDADGLLIESSDDAICHARSPSRLKSFDSPIMPVGNFGLLPRRGRGPAGRSGV